MLCLRLSRLGKTKQPHFRLIISEKIKNPLGKFLENLGSYNPRTKEASLKTERIKYWLSKGAQMAATVNNLLIEKKVIEGQKIKKLKISKRRKEKLAGEKKVEAPAA